MFWLSLKMSERQDGSYSFLDKREGRDKKYLRIVSNDFTLKRDMLTKTITVTILEGPISRTYIEVRICIDYSIIVKHVEDQSNFFIEMFCYQICSYFSVS
ncbi:unnamed protein product [Meloidogyne enterolobii]|uniref:Uncharacterized protein n=1 Tax=Meloidogyne enterolobii TaxID=390850 RepID=A0ACB0YI74_MELEN